MQHSTLIIQHSSFNIPHCGSAATIQHSTLNTQHSTLAAPMWLANIVFFGMKKVQRKSLFQKKFTPLNSRFHASEPPHHTRFSRKNELVDTKTTSFTQQINTISVANSEDLLCKTTRIAEQNDRFCNVCVCVFFCTHTAITTPTYTLPVTQRCTPIRKEKSVKNLFLRFSGTLGGQISCRPRIQRATDAALFGILCRYLPYFQ